jgi:TonB family protein
MRKAIRLFALSILFSVYPLVPCAAQNTTPVPGQSSPAPAATPSPQTKPTPKNKPATEVIELAPNNKSVIPVQKPIVVQSVSSGGSEGSGSSKGIEILSDTMGFDFGPYMKRLKYAVQNHWNAVMPDVARPPAMKSGTVTIELSVMKNGGVQDMKLVKSSGDVELDKAAWRGITDAIPLPVLPLEFKGDHLKLRCNFQYNPAPTPAQEVKQDSKK